MPSRSSKSMQLWVLIISAVLASATLWRLWEQDIFWQIRMGADLLQTGAFSHLDTWSFTAKDFTDTNFWWLPSLLFYFVEKYFHAGGLVVLRALFVFSYLFFCGEIIRHRLPARLPARATLALLLVLTFAANAFRFQLRPDFMVAIAMAFVVWIWTSTEISENKRIYISWLACLISANCHMGPPVLVIAAANVFIYFSGLNRNLRIFAMIATAATFFMTPNGFSSIPLLIKTLSYGSGAGETLHNYDWEPFSLSYFKLSAWGLTGIAWSAIFLLGVFGFLRERSLALKTLFVIFATLACYRFRGSVFCTPIALIFAIHTLESLVRNEKPKKTAMLFSGLAFAFFGGHVVNWPHPLGLSIDDWVYPTRGVELLKTIHPKPNIFHDPSLGNYLVWNLPEYPVLIDTREYPFAKTAAEVRAAQRTPEAMSHAVSNFSINVVFLPKPQTLLVEGKGIPDGIGAFFPKEKWALVYFDNHYFMLLSRITEHQSAIASHEYHELTPQFPPYYQLAQNPSVQQLNDLMSETERCLSEYPQNLYCAFTQFFVAKRAFPEKLNGALIRILSLRSQVPSYSAYVKEQIEIAEFFGAKDERQVLLDFY